MVETRHVRGSRRKPARTLDPEDIVTRPNRARRSALGLIGATFVGATAIVAGAQTVRTDRTDVVIRRDPREDTDSGRFADGPQAPDVTILSDEAGGSPGVTDRDRFRVIDARAADADIGLGADPRDQDLAGRRDPIGGGRGPAGDGDVAQIGDQPVDASDSGRNADGGDSDISIQGDAQAGPAGTGSGSGGFGRRGGGGEDPSDTDVNSFGDPIPARDKDPTDTTVSDRDETRSGDPSDQDRR